MARRTHAMHLENRAAQPGDLGNFLVRRIGMLGVADPSEHPQIVHPWMRQSVGRYADSHPKTERFAGFEHVRLIARRNVDDILGQQNISQVSIFVGNFDDGRIQIAPAEMRGAAVGE